MFRKRRKDADGRGSQFFNTLVFPWIFWLWFAADFVRPENLRLIILPCFLSKIRARHSVQGSIPPKNPQQTLKMDPPAPNSFPGSLLPIFGTSHSIFWQIPCRLVENRRRRRQRRTYPRRWLIPPRLIGALPMWTKVRRLGEPVNGGLSTLGTRTTKNRNCTVSYRFFPFKTKIFQSGRLFYSQIRRAGKSRGDSLQ